MSNLIDLTGQRFGRLTVIEKDNNRKTNCGSYWICQCECGNIKSIRSSSLRRGEIQSCGCYRLEQVIKAKKEYSEKYMIGRKFGKLTILARSEKRGSHGEIYWICQCDCGNTCEIRGADLRRQDGNQTISCGCYHKSLGEIKIEEILLKSNCSYISEYVFIDLPKARFDFAIIKNNKITRLIEYDGKQHYKEVKFWGSLELQQERDQRKNEYAKINNIPLVRIPYWELNNITLEMLMGDKYLIK